MRLLTIMLVLAVAATGAMAQQTASFGWEDGVSTVFGFYGNVGGTANVVDIVHTGNNALYAFEDPVGGTPQLYVGWVWGIQEGDEVTADIWCYDTTEGGAPSGRIWGHYTDTDHLNYTGSAGGNSTYSDGLGWSNLSHTWTFSGLDPDNNALMVEARMYSSAGLVDYWWDDITITAPEHCVIWFPNQNPVANDVSSWGGVKNLYR